ncbi:MAG: metabolite traffic protein EboE [Planctomycetota bacterium]
MKPKIGYCGNVHPGRNLDEVKENLQTYALAVKEIYSPNDPMRIGLWLSSTAVNELSNDQTLDQFADWINEKELIPYTLNGFPFGDFHQPVVKLEVYKPTWAQKDRLNYTVRLAKVLDKILPAAMEGTISTLPLGWPTKGPAETDDRFLNQCAENLLQCAQQLEMIAEQTGRQIMICIEPEPGCILDTADDVVEFFQNKLFCDEHVDLVRNRIGVCHDVCHSAVMLEDQTYAVDRYFEAGIRIGKVQISSAVAVNFEPLDQEQRQLVLSDLSAFCEPKYMHQTTIDLDGEIKFFNDLDLALNFAGSKPRGVWRVHFHVPIHLKDFGRIETSQNQIVDLINAIRTTGAKLPHFEVETYAWNVLPDPLKTETLAQGIAMELNWLDRILEAS